MDKNNHVESKENLGHGIKGETGTGDKNSKTCTNNKNGSKKNNRSNMDELL